MILAISLLLPLLNVIEQSFIIVKLISNNHIINRSASSSVKEIKNDRDDDDDKVGSDLPFVGRSGNDRRTSISSTGR